jgi:hypothetical protein
VHETTGLVRFMEGLLLDTELTGGRRLNRIPFPGVPAGCEGFLGLR